jgi:hypothetical protein
MTHTLRILAAAVGFEPTELSLTGFQDQYLKPLGHTAMWLTVVDLNHRMQESKSCALPLGERSMFARIVFVESQFVFLGTFIYYHNNISLSTPFYNNF